MLHFLDVPQMETYLQTQKRNQSREIRSDGLQTRYILEGNRKVVAHLLSQYG